MIAELFWPKEMRQVVANYKAEGTLNEEAVKCYNNILFMYSFVFCIPILLLLNEINTLGFILIVVILYAFFWGIKREYEQGWQCYLLGSKTNLKVSSSYTVGFDRRQVVYGILTNGSKTEVVIKIGRRYGYQNENLPEPSEVICVWFNKQSEFAMPDDDYIKRKYCLDKTLLAG